MSDNKNTRKMKWKEQQLDSFIWMTLCVCNIERFPAGKRLLYTYPVCCCIPVEHMCHPESESFIALKIQKKNCCTTRICVSLRNIQHKLKSDRSAESNSLTLPDLRFCALEFCDRTFVLGLTYNYFHIPRSRQSRLHTIQCWEQPIA